jgi:hypothetical protein
VIKQLHIDVLRYNFAMPSAVKSKLLSSLFLFALLSALCSLASAQAPTKTIATHPSESFVKLAKDIDAGKYFPIFPRFLSGLTTENGTPWSNRPPHPPKEMTSLPMTQSQEAVELCSSLLPA